MSSKAAPLHQKFWTLNVALLFFFMAGGVLFAYFRFFHGFASVANLNPGYPFGIWIAFDVACGVALAAGGFTTAAIVEIFGREKYHALVRPAILTAFIGYFLVALAVFFDLGKYYNIWHALVYWNGTSVLFEVAWCVMLYLTVLAIENLPNVIEQFKGDRRLPAWILWLLERLDRFCSRTMAFFVIAGVVLSFGHQSSLGTMMLIAPYKLHPLWYTPLSPLLFLTSAVSVGIPMVIFEGTLAAKCFGRKPETELLSGIARYIPWFLGTYLLLRIGDLAWRGVLAGAFDGSVQGNAFLIEFALFAVPYFLLKRKRVRNNPTLLFWCSVSVILAVVANRFNVFLVGMDMGPEWSYFPSVGEIAVTLAFVAFGVLLYKIGVNYLPILEEEH
ncbi:Ni/Fe-hydrogenase subunit HybB-like protein [Geothermobacter ehrlichii]|uniref:Ni/Fe-hydrogenase subunit HybB-like protein n=1 Tax=Geothermobacter ehrlichii TaxID=213224 RepID=A0A5D3WFJ8_9BACT|nr:Ni/Fe-hydrogenase cytochrome b subunit [Geothermobacter ehrlichii]TYO96629.1 Ni/Fe-hydrogenase subunit HybB-like protein [Geothermobacter ehrlichii]